MPEKHLRLFLALVAASVMLMTYQSHRGPLRPLAFLMVPLNYINQSITSVEDTISDTLDMLTLNERELWRLREEISSLKLAAQRTRELELQNERLLASLKLKAIDPRFFALARVVGKGSDLWSSSLVIDKGSGEGVGRDMAVITPLGLLGKVQEARGEFATVLLLDDRRFAAAVRLQDSRTEAVFSGQGRGRGTLKYIDPKAEVHEGEVVVTSGLDSLFPPGLPVGTVSAVSGDVQEMFLDVEVALFVDTSKVEEVVLLK